MSALQKPVLVLNRDFDAIDAINVRKAISTVFRENVNIIDNNYVEYDWEDWAGLHCYDLDYQDDNLDNAYIIGGKQKLLAPSVVILKEYRKIPPRVVKLTRKNLFIRDRGRCQYTGKKLSSRNFTIDHVIPRDKGGKSTFSNLVICDLQTNVAKGNKTPKEAGLKLLKTPTHPKWNPIYACSIVKKPEVWKNFLKKDLWNMYWDIELEE